MFKNPNNQIIVRTEKFNATLLNTILKHWNSITIQSFLKDKEETAKKALKSGLKKYLKEAKIDGDIGEVLIQYKQQTQIKKGSLIGRYFTDNGIGLASIKREIRHTIARDFYLDLDFKNCHPNILIQYCDKNGILIPSESKIRHYIENREDIFKMMSDLGVKRDEVKRTFLSIMNGGNFISFRNKEIDDYFNSIKFEMSAIHSKIVELNPHIKPTKAFNEQGSIFNKVICDIENRCLLFLSDFLTEEGYKCDVLVFDGIMIRNSGIDRNKLLNLLDAFPLKLQEATGYELYVEIKPMNDFIDLSELTKKDDILNQSEIYNANMSGEKGLADLYFKEKGSLLKIADEHLFWFWNGETKLWDEFKSWKLISSTIATYFEKMSDKLIKSVDDCELKDKLEKMKKTLGKSSTIKNVFDFLVQLCRNNEFNSQMNKTDFIFPIKGGKLLNVETGEIRERKTTDLFSFELDVEIEDDRKKVETIDNFILELMNGDENDKKALKRVLGYSISGFNNKKIFQIWYGKGNNGKSTLANMISNIFGKYSTTLAESVVYKLGQKASAGSANSELYQLKNIHFGIVNENDEDYKLSSQMVKQITSGGEDKITTRRLYGDQETFYVKAKIALLVNNKPDFKSSDESLIKRIRYIPFLNNFSDTKENIEKVSVLKKDYRNALFSWLIDGLKDYLREGELLEFEKGKELLDIEVKDNDKLQNYLEENWEKCEDDKTDKTRVKLSDFAKWYKGWSLENVRTGQIRDMIMSKGFEIVRNSVDYIKGIRRIENKK